MVPWLGQLSSSLPSSPALWSQVQHGESLGIQVTHGILYYSYLIFLRFTGSDGSQLEVMELVGHYDFQA